MMAIERKHNLSDLYAQYEGRMPEQNDSHEERLDLKLDKSALRHLTTNRMHEVVAQYDKVQQGDPENIFREHGNRIGEKRKFFESNLTERPSLHFDVTKIYGRMNDDFIDDAGAYPPRSPGEKMESVVFGLYEDESDVRKEIGEYRLDRNIAELSEWALNDRMVRDKYREQGIGSVLLSATEAFVQKYADKEEVPQKLTANTGQPRVLIMLLNKGFIPSTAEDRRRMEMVLAADPSLELYYAVIKSEVWNDDGPTGEFQWVSETFKDPYVFPKGVERKTEVAALRVNLGKVFVPKITQVDRTRQDVKTRLAIEKTQV